MNYADLAKTYHSPTKFGRGIIELLNAKSKAAIDDIKTGMKVNATDEPKEEE